MRYLVSAAVLTLALGACGDSSENDSGNATKARPPLASATEPAPSAAAGDECEQYDDVSSGGRPLCEFRDSPSYGYRLALAKSVDQVLPAVQAIAPWTEATNLTDLYGTCDDVAHDSPRLLENAVSRFSGGSDEQVTSDQAKDLIAIAQQYICP